MLAKRFEHILHDLGMAELEHPLFYHAPVGIRFEIQCFFGSLWICIISIKPFFHP